MAILKMHQFIVVVDALSRERAAAALRLAFANRQPDGCLIFIRKTNPARKKKVGNPPVA